MVLMEDAHWRYRKAGKYRYHAWPSDEFVRGRDKCAASVIIIQDAQKGACVFVESERRPGVRQSGMQT
jgi:hypothetical protein